MKNRKPPRPKGHAIPKFTPVPRQRNRHDGWTPERQRAFIEALARTGSVSHAAAEVNMATEGAYQLRLHPKGESFRKAWEAALDFGVQRLEDSPEGERERASIPPPDSAARGRKMDPETSLS